MIALILLSGLLLAVLLQGMVRRWAGAGSGSVSRLPRLSAYLLLTAGETASIVPLITLVFDAFAVRSIAELLVLVTYLLISLAFMLAPWIWLRRAWRRSQSHSSYAFVVGTSVANIAIALVLYRRLLLGDADSQDGIVVLIVPLMQLVVIAASAFMRRAMEPRSHPATAAG